MCTKHVVLRLDVDQCNIVNILLLQFRHPFLSRTGKRKSAAPPSDKHVTEDPTVWVEDSEEHGRAEYSMLIRGIQSKPTSHEDLKKSQLLAKDVAVFCKTPHLITVGSFILTRDAENWQDAGDRPGAAATGMPSGNSRDE